jgi:hypothetical protein
VPPARLGAVACVDATGEDGGARHGGRW